MFLFSWVFFCQSYFHEFSLSSFEFKNVSLIVDAIKIIH